MARGRLSGIALPLAEVILVGLSLAALQACAEAKAVSVEAGRLDQVRVGFGLDLAGRVSPGCAASTFALRDPIHLSMQVTGAKPGSVVRVSVSDVVTNRVAWREDRTVPPGGSYQTFAIGRGIALGSYRAESTLGGQATRPWPFLVHNKRRGVR
jgi:hypothetical protein